VNQTLKAWRVGKTGREPWVLRACCALVRNESSGFPPRAEPPTGPPKRNRPVAARERTLRRPTSGSPRNRGFRGGGNARLLFGT